MRRVVVVNVGVVVIVVVVVAVVPRRTLRPAVDITAAAAVTAVLAPGTGPVSAPWSWPSR